MKESQTIIRIKFGSHLYGTDTPDSDLDYKSIFLPPAREILLQKVRHTISDKRPKQPFEKNVAGESDEESLALHRYLDLLAQGQTVALNILFAPPSAFISEPHPLWAYVCANRERLLSRKSSAFVGYCRQQANKYGIKGSRVHAVRNIVEWFDQAIEDNGHSSKIFENSDFLSAFIFDKNLEHTKIIRILSKSQNKEIPHLECCNRKVPFFATLKEGRAIYARILDEYGARALQAENNENVDWKALSHAVRVATQAIELMANSHITFPLPNASHILDIKTGKIPYKEVASEIEYLLACVESAELRSILPPEPDHQFIDDLIVDAYRSQITA